MLIDTSKDWHLTENGMSMNTISRATSKAGLALGTLIALSLSASACASRAPEVRDWGGPISTANVTPSLDVAPTQVGGAALFGPGGQTTFTQGCTGSFSVRDTRSNRDISTGRAVNTGQGLVVLDSQGRRTRTLSSTMSQSITFLPDCNCRAGGNQSSEAGSTQQLAATAPSPATCHAG
jgi:hypothetical protein